jgi:hypothetical protein
MKRLISFFLLIVAAAWMLAAALNPASAAPDARVTPDVWAQLDARGQADVILQLPQADLSPAYALPDKAARGRWVYETLRVAADQAQKPIVAELKRSGASYQRFWAVNAIQVQVDEKLLARLLRFPQVQRVSANEAFRAWGQSLKHQWQPRRPLARSPGASAGSTRLGRGGRESQAKAWSSPGKIQAITGRMRR